MHFLNPSHPLYFSPRPKLPDDRGYEGLPMVSQLAFRKLCRFYQSNERVVWKRSGTAQLSGLRCCKFPTCKKASIFFKGGGKKKPNLELISISFDRSLGSLINFECRCLCFPSQNTPSTREQAHCAVFPSCHTVLVTLVQQHMLRPYYKGFL